MKKILSDNQIRIGFFLILFLTFLSFSGPIISNYDPLEQGDLIKERFLSPSEKHFFGTDKFGRDVFSRVLYGARISLSLAFGVVLTSTILALLIGTFAAYKKGWARSAIIIFLDFLLAIPLIFLVIALLAIMGNNLLYLFLILVLTGWMEPARLIYAEALSITERDYILAAKGFGFKTGRILIRHIIPNCLKLVVTFFPLKIAEIILIESSLSFLGVGILPPTPTLGSIISDGKDVLISAWWVVTFPGLFMTMIILSFYIIGEGLKKYYR